MDYLKLFRMPTPVKITGRSSSITNAFVNSIIPAIMPTSDEVEIALGILGMDRTSYQCAYCGDTATEWDHLRPLVLSKKPTGYISEIHNLVPACGKCNQSKGNKPWAEWIISDARLSPKSRGINDLDMRVIRLRKYEDWQEPTKLDFEAIVGQETWRQHWTNWENVLSSMKAAQTLATQINKKISSKYSK